MKVKVNVVDLYSTSTWSISKALRYSTHCQGITQFYLHTQRFIRERNKPYLLLPSQPQLVLIYQSWRDGRLSRPWCEVAPTKIRTCNLVLGTQCIVDHRDRVGWYVQICGDIHSQLKLVPDLQPRLSAVRRQLLCSAGTLHRSASYIVVYPFHYDCNLNLKFTLWQRLFYLCLDLRYRKGIQIIKKIIWQRYPKILIRETWLM